MGSPSSLHDLEECSTVWDITLENYFQNSIPSTPSLLSMSLVLWYFHCMTRCPQVIPNSTCKKITLKPFSRSFDIITFHLLAEVRNLGGVCLNTSHKPVSTTLKPKSSKNQNWFDKVASELIWQQNLTWNDLTWWGSFNIWGQKYQCVWSWGAVPFPVGRVNIKICTISLKSPKF